MATGAQGYAVDRALPCAAMRRPHAVIIGSGFGGLAAAVRLGARGYRVTRAGAARRSRAAAPTCTARTASRSTPAPPSSPRRSCSRSCGQLAGGAWPTTSTCAPSTPFYRIRFDDGTSFDYSGDPAAMRAEVARLVARRRRGLRALHARQRGIFQVGLRAARRTCRSTRGRHGANPPGDAAAARATAPSTALVARHVRDPRLRQVLSFHPLLVGGNPFTVTSIYCLIAFLERSGACTSRWAARHRLVQRTGRD